MRMSMAWLLVVGVELKLEYFLNIEARGGGGGVQALQ